MIELFNVSKYFIEMHSLIQFEFFYTDLLGHVDTLSFTRRGGGGQSIVNIVAGGGNAVKILKPVGASIKHKQGIGVSLDLSK